MTIPGWYMCDGQNGTPDLRERFIAGCSQSGGNIPASPGKFGGDNTFRLKTDHLPTHAHSIPAHNHTGTVADGGSVTDHLCSVTSHEGHKHTIDGKELTLKHKLYNIGGSGARTRVLDYTDDKYYWEWGVTIPSHSHNCQNAGSHTHTVKVSLPSHKHGITVYSGGSGNTGSIGGNAAVDMSKNIKGYAVIFIMKNY